MASYLIDLLPKDEGGEIETVELRTDLSIYDFYILQKEECVSKEFLNALLKSNANVLNVKDEDLINAPYMAYKKANPNGLIRDEFNQRVGFEIEVCVEIVGDIIKSGSSKESKFANNFRKVTKKGKK